MDMQLMMFGALIIQSLKCDIVIVAVVFVSAFVGFFVVVVI